ncbi:MAG: excinuclease subunit [Caulobacter sp.]|nr:excinuclease subunit [Caulobacter sp.]
MNKLVAAVALPLALLIAAGPAAQAAGRDEHINFPIADVLGNPEFKAKLPAGVRYYFGSQKAKVSRRLGETNTNKKTSSFHKSDKTACEWAMLSALIAIGEDARGRGGNAVVGIKSNYKDVETSSNDTYVCGAGGIMAGVALKGTVAVVR